LFAGSLAAQPASNLGTITDEEINKGRRDDRQQRH
jgi:hypothetical protein